MAIFDSLPKELRVAINESVYGHTKLMLRVYNDWRKGKKIKAILRYIENSNLERQSHAPAEREAAEAFLKSIGLD
jgi:hypothetical protein